MLRKLIVTSIAAAVAAVAVEGAAARPLDEIIDSGTLRVGVNPDTGSAWDV